MTSTSSHRAPLEADAVALATAPGGLWRLGTHVSDRKILF